MTVHGFASFGSGGFRARCVHGCGWRGPVRGLSLSVVERDAEEHFAGCSERSKPLRARRSAAPVDELRKGNRV